MSTDYAEYTAGSLVKARGREWVVLPESTGDFVIARPLNGDPDFTAGLFRDEVSEATFPKPSTDPEQIGDYVAAGLLRTAMRIGFTSGAGPLRSLAEIAVEPRHYQLVPLLMALRQETVRLLIGDGVGIGKTVEAGLIAKELLARGDAARLAVLCPPALAEQWAAELRNKFGIEATLVLPSTARRLQRDVPPTESLFHHHRFTVVSTDFVKTDDHRALFVNHCPDLVIVDEAHTCVPSGDRGTRQQRYLLLSEIAKDTGRHLILVTATPHSGKEESFRDLIGLLDPELSGLPLEEARNRDRLAKHFVQRRRHDIRRFLDEDTPFPGDRLIRDTAYHLSPAYADLMRDILAYARETVRRSDGAHRQRIRWWSALALLRSVASSPAAAKATLETRAATTAAQTLAEIEDLGRGAVLDDAMDDDPLDGLDATPGALADDEDTFTRRDRERLRAFAKRAAELGGPEHDAKLHVAIQQVRGLLLDACEPIVFCRYVTTAEYVAEHLRTALGRETTVKAVTGKLAPEEREQRIANLAATKGRHVLVATDCLSEGVNLQDHFNAVLHYDLAWNPTRHEQREGRVDRFGQTSPNVRAETLYGADNAIDGVVLNVLIKKGRAIRKSTGVAVPVPEKNTEVVDAIVEGLLLRDTDGEQLPLDMDVTTARTNLERAWDSAADRESKAITKYQQAGVDLEEVQKEVAEIRAALGSHADVAAFTRRALSELDAGIRTRQDGFAAETQAMPLAVRGALGLVRNADAAPGRKDHPDLVFHDDLPVPAGEHALVRTDPFVADLARYVVDASLDPHIKPGQRPASRCGVIRTAAVRKRTVMLLVRYRFHLDLPGRRETKHLVAEDAQVLAYRAGEAPGDREWLSEEEAAALLDAAPDRNALPEQVTRAAERAVAELDDLEADLNARGVELAKRLRESHVRVRATIGQSSTKLKVAPHERADVLGVFVYLPSPNAETGGAQ